MAAALACSAGEESRDSRFVGVAAGVVHDAQTQRVWTAKDGAHEVSWGDASHQCRSLELDPKAQAWRLPTIDELATLYDTSIEQPCGGSAICKVDPAIELTSPYHWSATAPNPKRRFYFDFVHGTRLSPLLRPGLTRRVLCTRDEG